MASVFKLCMCVISGSCTSPWAWCVFYFLLKGIEIVMGRMAGMKNANKYISPILTLHRPPTNRELESNLIFQPGLNSGGILLIPVVQLGLEFIFSASRGGKQLVWSCFSQDYLQAAKDRMDSETDTWGTEVELSAQPQQLDAWTLTTNLGLLREGKNKDRNRTRSHRVSHVDLRSWLTCRK